MVKDPIIDEQLENRIRRCGTARIPAVQISIEEKAPRIRIENIVPPTFRSSCKGSGEVDNKRRVKALFRITLWDQIRRRVSLLFFRSVICSDGEGTIWSEITMRPWFKSILEFLGFLIALLKPIVDFIISLFR
jgi:hypothetical protein